MNLRAILTHLSRALSWPFDRPWGRVAVGAVLLVCALIGVAQRLQAFWIVLAVGQAAYHITYGAVRLLPHGLEGYKSVPDRVTIIGVIILMATVVVSLFLK
jgi:4-hydroxybenzoate polyprenyltransferase